MERVMAMDALGLNNLYLAGLARKRGRCGAEAPAGTPATLSAPRVSRLIDYIRLGYVLPSGGHFRYNRHSK